MIFNDLSGYCRTGYSHFETVIPNLIYRLKFCCKVGVSIYPAAGQIIQYTEKTVFFRITEKPASQYPI